MANNKISQNSNTERENLNPKQQGPQKNPNKTDNSLEFGGFGMQIVLSSRFVKITKTSLH